MVAQPLHVSLLGSPSSIADHLQRAGCRVTDASAATSWWSSASTA
jgi:hypothetical protein